MIIILLLLGLDSQLGWKDENVFVSVLLLSNSVVGFLCLQFHDLQECYLHKRRQWAKQAHELEARNLNDEGSSYYHGSLEDFQSVLSTVTRYRYVACQLSFHSFLQCHRQMLKIHFFVFGLGLT